LDNDERNPAPLCGFVALMPFASYSLTFSVLDCKSFSAFMVLWRGCWTRTRASLVCVRPTSTQDSAE